MIEFWELIKESINTLRLNKMRTSLAVLGIVIGIGSVIALFLLVNLAKNLSPLKLNLSVLI